MVALFLGQLELAAPLFALIAVGFVVIRWAGWGSSVASGMNTFVFNLALPALLFHLMSGLSRLPRSTRACCSPSLAAALSLS